MNTGDVMTVGAATVRVGATVADAARLMLEHHISGLPVVDDAGKLVGMVTERDLLRRAELGTDHRRPRWLEFLLGPGELADEYVRSHTRRIEDVMTRNVTSVTAETPLEEVVRVMERYGFKRLPVVRDGAVVGIISRANLLRALARRVDEASAAAGSDVAVRRRLVEELERQNWMPREGIDIVVRDGVVELRGMLEDERVRQAIRVAAESTQGVRQVDDQLRVIEPIPKWV